MKKLLLVLLFVLVAGGGLANAEHAFPNAYVILHRDGAVWNSQTGWDTNTPPYYPGTNYAVDIAVDNFLDPLRPGCGYVILHRDGALYSTTMNPGWTLTTPPYYPGSDYARRLKFETFGQNPLPPYNYWQYAILHKDGAIYDSINGWDCGLAYYPGETWAVSFYVIFNVTY